ncbi:MAG: DMT family transporter, partial [Lactococcus lactis]|nr:DMT family transporter [Lactococcus lactis]
MYIYLAFALVGGFLLANQNPINADLRKIVGSPFLASGISNFVGSIFLGIITLVTTQELFPSFQFVSSHPAWLWIGGIFGGIFLTSNVLLFPRLGAVQTVILPILGQILMGTLIDSFGWFHAMQLPMTLMRFMGIVITLIGVIIAVVLPNLKEKEAEKPKGNLLGWRIWAVIAGAMSAAQQAINGRLGVLLENTAQAAFVSFLIGFLAIFIVSLFVDRRLPKISDLKKAKPWNGIGGFLGASVV